MVIGGSMYSAASGAFSWTNEVPTREMITGNPHPGRPEHRQRTHQLRQVLHVERRYEALPLQEHVRDVTPPGDRLWREEHVVSGHLLPGRQGGLEEAPCPERMVGAEGAPRSRQPNGKLGEPQREQVLGGGAADVVVVGGDVAAPLDDPLAHHRGP